MPDYLNALRQEISHRYKGETLDTLYFGGGTPSLIDLEPIMKLFNLGSDAEITVEANPETPLPLRGRGEGFRVSFGVQTFDDNILRLIGRRHTGADAIKTIEACPVENISADFIYGLPTQTIEGFTADLLRAVDLGVKHISLYGLKIEEGCDFYGKLETDEDLQADMYLAAIDTLQGFEHYEISNFARAGFESRHNLNYWNNCEYYGFGVAAHGYESGVRYANTCDLRQYIANPLEHASQTTITVQMQLEEEIFLGFRKMSGIDVKAINKKYGIDFEQRYGHIIKKYSSCHRALDARSSIKTPHLGERQRPAKGIVRGDMECFLKTSQGYALTTNGVLVSNAVLSEFID